MTLCAALACCGKTLVCRRCYYVDDITTQKTLVYRRYYYIDDAAEIIAQAVAECRLPSEGWRLLRIRANGIGWQHAPSCARCAWS